MHVSGKPKIKIVAGNDRGACTQSTQFALCPPGRRRCGTFEDAQPGMATGGGVVNPKETSTRARAKSAPLASHSRIAADRAASGIAAVVPASTRGTCFRCGENGHWTSECNNNANPEAASRALVQFRQAGREPEPSSYASAPNSQSIVLLGTAAASGLADSEDLATSLKLDEDDPHEEVGNLLQEGGSSTRPPFFFGGGTTGEVAVCDETPHRFLAQRYRELEMCAHTDAFHEGVGNSLREGGSTTAATDASKKKLSMHARSRSSADMATREEEERHAANSGTDHDDSSDSEEWEPRYEEIRRTRSTTSYLMHMAYRTQGSSSEPVDDQMWKGASSTAPLIFGGGTTGVVQVCDTTPARTLSKRYSELQKVRNASRQSRGTRVGNPTVILAREREARGTPHVLGVIPEQTQPHYATAVSVRILEDWETQRCGCKNSFPMTKVFTGEYQLRCFHCLKPYRSTRGDSGTVDTRASGSGDPDASRPPYLQHTTGQAMGVGQHRASDKLSFR
jgi:hypothetical protein